MLPWISAGYVYLVGRPQSATYAMQYEQTRPILQTVQTQKEGLRQNPSTAHHVLLALALKASPLACGLRATRGRDAPVHHRILGRAQSGLRSSYCAVVPGNDSFQYEAPLAIGAWYSRPATGHDSEGGPLTMLRLVKLTRPWSRGTSAPCAAEVRYPTPHEEISTKSGRQACPFVSIHASSFFQLWTVIRWGAHDQ